MEICHRRAQFQQRADIYLAPATAGTGQESITTEAGSFNAFVIETDFTGKNVQDLSLVNQTAWRTWFEAPMSTIGSSAALVFRQRGNLVQNDISIDRITA